MLKLACGLMAAGTMVMCAAEKNQTPAQKALLKWNWNVGPVYTVRSADFQFSTRESGGGIGGELFVANNVSVYGLGTIYNVQHSVVDEVSFGANAYVPVVSFAALFGSLGTLKGFEQNENWNYKVGGGVVGFFNDKVYSKVGGFVVDDFLKKPELRFEASLNVRF